MIDDRVDTGVRDLRRFDGIQCSCYVHVTCKGKTVWEHSPTRRKENELVRRNRGVNSPINCPISSLLESPRGAPHGRPRGCVASLPHGCAPCASCAGHPGAATWPQCRVATRGGPARHVILWVLRQVSLRVATSAPTGNKTPFSRFC